MSTTTKARRQNKRWLDGDCPSGVLAIYDDPRFIDRFTIFYVPQDDRDWVEYLSASAEPYAPQGMGLHLEMQRYQAREFRYRAAHKAATWSSLPEDVKRAVRQDLA